MKADLMIPYQNLFFHALFSLCIAFIITTLGIPVRWLQGLHTYVHPENLGNDGPRGNVRAAIRPPSSSDMGDLGANAFHTFSDHKRRSSRSKEKFEFDETNAQIYRLRLVDAHLRSRLFFGDFNLATIYSIAASLNLLLHHFLPAPENNDRFLSGGSAVPVGLGLLAISKIVVIWAKISFDKSASKRSDKQLSILLALLGFLTVLLVILVAAPSCFDFEFHSLHGSPVLILAICAGAVTSFLSLAAGKIARSFWLGTDQLRWNLSVISCGTFSRILLYTSIFMAVFASSLWVNPVVEIFVRKEGSPAGWPTTEVLSGRMGMVRPDFMKFRVWCLLVSAILQLLVLRPMLQMYLNEAVLSWYQRLHSSKVPDLDYSRAKMFLHNYYFCLVVLQFFAAPMLVLLFTGLSVMRGNLFQDFPFIRSLTHLSSATKEVALFMAWWVLFVWTAFTSGSLLLYRLGFSFVS
ncbi:hypothetical protein H6P81_008393 [Aristolochia fimbriata]|uniref:Transmembrane protein 161B n=1 Tax=Aristolochia fimbriata TaxID=158543 RepID=A0AAV7F3K8_ARIFI|nr:hypothetical protein H6P81_008393 [Aristolochia fimbriata]